MRFWVLLRNLWQLRIYAAAKNALQNDVDDVLFPYTDYRPLLCAYVTELRRQDWVQEHRNKLNERRLSQHDVLVHDHTT